MLKVTFNIAVIGNNSLINFLEALDPTPDCTEKVVSTESLESNRTLNDRVLLYMMFFTGHLRKNSMRGSIDKEIGAKNSMRFP